MGYKLKRNLDKAGRVTALTASTLGAVMGVWLLLAAFTDGDYKMGLIVGAVVEVLALLLFGVGASDNDYRRPSTSLLTMVACGVLIGLLGMGMWVLGETELRYRGRMRELKPQARKLQSWQPKASTTSTETIEGALPGKVTVMYAGTRRFHRESLEQLPESMIARTMGDLDGVVYLDFGEDLVGEYAHNVGLPNQGGPGAFRGWCDVRVVDARTRKVVAFTRIMADPPPEKSGEEEHTEVGYLAIEKYLTGLAAE